MAWWSTGYLPGAPYRAWAGDSRQTPSHEVPHMIYFKSCQRCSGDRSLESDMYGWYVICLSCGFVTYPDIVAKQKPAAAARRTA